MVTMMRRKKRRRRSWLILRRRLRRVSFDTLFSVCLLVLLEEDGIEIGV